ncbi:MAG: hypothetical protein WDZ40_01150 [Candidatus Spechtbacterales bacterium]
MAFKKKNKRVKNFDAVIKNKNPRKRKRKRVSFVRKFIFTKYFVVVSIFLVVVAVLVYYFLFSGEFEIKEVSINGVNEELASNLKAYYEKTAEEKVLVFLNRNNTILFPKNKFEVGILRDIPKIKSVDVKLSPPNALNIEVIERKQKGIWCNYAGNPAVAPCYFYDTEGFVYEDAPGVSRGSIIVAIRDTRTPDVTLPQQVLDTETSDYLDKLVEALEIAYNRPTHVTIEEWNTIKVHYSDWDIYFSRSNPVIESVENFVLVLDEKIGARVNELEYIDLRLGNKVFYKWQGGAE